jgi:hypothetical protein
MCKERTTGAPHEEPFLPSDDNRAAGDSRVAGGERAFRVDSAHRYSVQRLVDLIKARPCSCSTSPACDAPRDRCNPQIAPKKGQSEGET